MTPEEDPPTTPYPPYAEDATTLAGKSEVVAGAIAADDVTSVSGVYALGEVIGSGGMGEVLVAHDRRIGRDVALKRLHAVAPSEDEVRRFLREARIQARLEHPAIVPVYELARDEVGRSFFTMKRVVGTTLTELFAQGASRQRMLRAFGEVCRAIDYAHSRGVVHRDLKPANILLGEFGEVYVLDWGIARVVGDTKAGVETADIDTIEGAAPANANVIGTPGYSSPEQLHSPNVDRPADVYSLGCILFELLAGESVHPRGVAAIASTMAGETVMSPALRRPDRNVPPELDALCTKMLLSKPTARPSARNCADRIEEYLDGDRDVARRRVMAHDLVAVARDAYREGRTGDAMRIASRAVALDPEAREAGDLVMHVLLQPPAEMSPAAHAELQRSDGEGISTHARAALPGYLLIASFLPVIVWNGVRSWPVVLAGFFLALALAVAAWDLTRRPLKSVGYMVVYAIANSLLLALLTRLVGPLLVVPALVSFITGSVVTYPTFLSRKWLLIGIFLAGWVGPIILEAFGVLAPTWELTDAGLLTYGDAMQVRGTPTIATIVLGGIAIIVMAGIQSARISNASREAHHRLVLHAHQLRQLLPAR